MVELARRQHGVIATRQLRELGLSQNAVASRVRSGLLTPLHRGVYAVGAGTEDPHQRWMAAVLSGTGGVYLSHRSAGVLLELLPSDGGLTHVICHDSRVRHHARVKGHRARNLDYELDCTIRNGIPVTNVARTLLDLAGSYTYEVADAAINAALDARLFDRDAVLDVCGRNRGHRGAGHLSRRAAAVAAPELQTRSGLERRFLRFCRRHGLAEPEVNATVLGLEVDALWRSARLIVELDGRRYHDRAGAFETDRARDARLQAGGFRVVRVTGQRLHRDAGELVSQLRALGA